MARRRKAPKSAIVVARIGLAARSGFYLLLVYLIVRVAAASRNKPQANAHGALTTVARGAPGTALLVAIAVGFAGFGGIRIWAGIRDDSGSKWRRASALLQGIFYVGMTWLPLSYALGNRSAGNEQQQHKTAGDLLHLPGGPVIVFVLGLVIIGVAIGQIWRGVGRDYLDSMDVDGAPPWVRTLVLASGTIGIPARALTFLPLGIFFMIAAVQGDPARADGLDGELTLLTRNGWGDLVLTLCAIGLLIFVVYSGLEVRYREVAKGR